MTPRPRRRAPRIITSIVLAVALALGTLGFVAAPANAASKSVATNAEFKKIKGGQTLSQVRAIIDSRGDQLGTGVYRWKSTQRRHVFVFFDENGRVEMKLRLSTVTSHEYSKIKKKNSYDRVKRIIGGPSLFSFQDNDVRYRLWPSNDLQETIIIAFKHGKVISKSRDLEDFADAADLGL